MKRHEIYEEFRNKLKNETNENIIKYINKTCLNGKYIDKFLYYSCGFDNYFIVKYILNNYKPSLEDSIYNAIKYENVYPVIMCGDHEAKDIITEAIKSVEHILPSTDKITISLIH